MLDYLPYHNVIALNVMVLREPDYYLNVWITSPITTLTYSMG